MNAPVSVDREAMAALVDRIEQLHAKVDTVLAFCALVEQTAAPMLRGKGKIWLAMAGKIRGGD